MRRRFSNIMSANCLIPTFVGTYDFNRSSILNNVSLFKICNREDMSSSASLATYFAQQANATYQCTTLDQPKKNVNALFGYNNNIVYVNINNNNQLDFNMKLKFSVDDIFFYLLILTKNGGSPDTVLAYMQELSREEYSITQVYEYIESSYTDLPYIVL